MVELEHFRVLSALLRNETLVKKPKSELPLERLSTHTRDRSVPKNIKMIYQGQKQLQKLRSMKSTSELPSLTKTSNHNTNSNNTEIIDSPSNKSPHQMLSPSGRSSVVQASQKNIRSSVMRGTVLHEERATGSGLGQSNDINASVMSVSTSSRPSAAKRHIQSYSLSKNSSTRELYPFENTDNQVIFPPNKEHVQNILQELSEEYQGAFFEKSKKENRERFLNKVINSGKVFEQFDVLSRRRQEILNELSTKVRHQNEQSNNNSSKRLWVSPLSIYQKSSFTRFNERTKRLDSLTRPATKSLSQPLENRATAIPTESKQGDNKGKAGIHQGSDGQEADEGETSKIQGKLVIKAKNPKNNSKTTHPHAFSYDKGVFMKYILDFVNLAKLTDEIQMAKTLGDESKDDIKNAGSLNELDLDLQKENILKTSKVNSPSDLFPDLKEMQKHIKSKFIYLCVLKEQYQDMFKDRKMIGDRILLALNINPDREFHKIDWEMYLKFAKVAIQYEAPRTELTKFILKFFKLNDYLLTASSVKATLRFLCKEIESELPPNKQSGIYDAILENWTLTGIISNETPYVNIENFKLVYGSNKLDIYQLLDMITHRRR